MRLRELCDQDVPLMLEWMHDPAVNRHFRFDAAGATRESVSAFVAAAREPGRNLHLACVDDEDCYLGTISLKNIDDENKTAEYAISFRPAAQGSGAARFATGEILRIAFEERGLERVYLDVLAENEHAWHFYEKQGFVFEGILRRHIELRGKRRSLRLYGMLKEEWEQRR